MFVVLVLCFGGDQFGCQFVVWCGYCVQFDFGYFFGGIFFICVDVCCVCCDDGVLVWDQVGECDYICFCFVEYWEYFGCWFEFCVDYFSQMGCVYVFVIGDLVFIVCFCECGEYFWVYVGVVVGGEVVGVVIVQGGYGLVFQVWEGVVILWVFLIILFIFLVRVLQNIESGNLLFSIVLVQFFGVLVRMLLGRLWVQSDVGFGVRVW